MKHKISPILISLAFAFPAVPSFAAQMGKTYKLTVLHTNDTHGRFWQNDKGEYGFAAQKTLIDKLKREVKAQGGEVILVNAGDLNTGVPESDLQKAIPDIEGLNAIGYEVMSLGNHEFDFHQNVLKQQIKKAKFPFIAANVYDKKTKKPLVKPYVTFNKGGLKVLVYGLLTEETAKLAHPKFTQNIEFKPVIDVTRKELPKIKAKEKPDFTIALTHMGWYLDGNHGNLAPGDVTLARSLPKGTIDIIVGGHSHTAVCFDDKGDFIQKYTPGTPCEPDYQNGTHIVQAEKWGKYVGRADFEIKDGKATLVKYELIPVNLKKTIRHADGSKTYQNYTAEIKNDKKLYNHLKKFQDKGDKLLNVEVGTLKGDLIHHRESQTNFGKLVASVQKDFVKADIGIVNSGGIRISLNEGKVTYRDILTAEPFNNTITTFSLSGKELREYLNAIAFKTSGGYPQFAGITMTLDNSTQRVSDVKINGKKLVLSKQYKISIPDYLAVGGDGYPKMDKNPSYINTGYVDAQLLKEFFETKKVINASDFDATGTITYKN